MFCILFPSLLIRVWSYCWCSCRFDFPYDFDWDVVSCLFCFVIGKLYDLSALDEITAWIAGFAYFVSAWVVAECEKSRFFAVDPQTRPMARHPHLPPDKSAHLRSDQFHVTNVCQRSEHTFTMPTQHPSTLTNTHHIQNPKASSRETEFLALTNV